MDRALEIEDPKDGIALAGKVTWFNPENSKYCILASRQSGDGDGGGGGGSSGSGEPKEGSAHWISVDKLVEAKAMGVHKNGKRLQLKAPPSVEGHEARTSTESGYQQERVNIQQREAEGESDVPSQDEQGEIKKEKPPREEGTTADFGGTEKGEEDAGTAIGKRRRDTSCPPTSGADIAPTKRLARLEVQPRQAKALELDSQPLLPEPGGGEATEAVPLLAEGAASSENGEKSSSLETERGVGMAHPIQQQPRFLPSVQFPQQEPDAFTRYPIRGRLKCPTKAIGDPIARRGLEGTPSTKRLRQDVEPHQENVAAGQDGMEPECAKEAVPGSPIHSKGGVPRDNCSAFDLEPGWPHGSGLGLVPVMRVRAVRLPGGGDATYFASAYFASTSQNVVCNKRSSPSFSFGFEELETKLSGGATKQQQSGNIEEVYEPSERVEGNDPAENDAGNKETDGAEVSVAPFARKSGHEEGQSVYTVEETARKTKIASSDGGDVEDGEANASSDGGVDCMPSSPRSTDTNGGDVERASGTGEQGREEGGGVGGQDEQTVPMDASNVLGPKGECNDSTEANEMEISSDGGSCCGFEGAEAASPFISEDEDEDDDDFGRGWGLGLDRGEAPGLSRVGIQSHFSGVGDASSSAVAGPSAGATETTQDLPGRLSTERVGAVESPESPSDVDAMRSSDPEDWKQADLGVTVEATNASGGRSNSELVEGGSAVEAGPEIVVANPTVPQQTEMIMALRRIVREQLQRVLRSASKGEEAALAGSDGNDVLERIAANSEDELFRRLYQDSTGGREYKVGYSVARFGLLFP